MLMCDHNIHQTVKKVALEPEHHGHKGYNFQNIWFI